MLTTTVSALRCPKTKKSKVRCLAPLNLRPKKQSKVQENPEIFEVTTGHLECTQCRSTFPILAGVAILVHDVGSYLLSHVKGVSARVPMEDIPKEFRQDFLEAKNEIEEEHIEEDLEAERVNALYLMNHFLRTTPAHPQWWKPASDPASPPVDQWIQKYWDQGPFQQIEAWISDRPRPSTQLNAIELGCGVGGLYRQLSPYLSSYLGVDGSFASISLARQLALGIGDRTRFRVPGDLLQGPLSQEVSIAIEHNTSGKVDFVVGDLDSLALVEGQANLCIALNTIDMLDSPELLPQLQHSLLRPGGIGIQSCPYIWHEKVAKKLRRTVPNTLRDSAKAVQWLYEQAGFKIQFNRDHVPWLFFKHFRQIELYSVHVFMGQKSSSPIT